MADRAMDGIRFHLHCRACMAGKPINQSPREWSRLAAGLSDSGILVYCKRCKKEVAHFTPEQLAEQLQTARCDCCPGGKHAVPL